MESLDFSRLFHLFSKDGSRHHPRIPADPKEWPEEWKTTYYKLYERLPKVQLPSSQPSADFFTLITKRQSRRDFSRTHLSLLNLSVLLKYSCGNTAALGKKRFRRAQASGGARFPIEVYVIVFRSNKDIQSGLYHYNVRDHALDILWEREFSDEDIGYLFTYPWVKDAAVGIVMTSVFWRNQNKYGERGYRYILLEAGHIAQNFYLTSEALRLKCCALGGTWDKNLEELIDIDGVTESVVYGLAIGK